jgi:leucyl/phenylalanyl-tRNA--protein transferase
VLARPVSGARSAAVRVVKRAVVGLVAWLGIVRVVRWTVESGRLAPPVAAELSDELAPCSTFDPAEVIAQYLRGYVMLGRRTDTGYEPTFRRVPVRAVIDERSVHVSARMRRRIARSGLVVDFDAPFDQVVAQCAARAVTWLSPSVVARWRTVADAGYVRTVGAYRDGVLVAGCFGIDVGTIFGGLSWFHLESGAGEILEAVVTLQVGERWTLRDCGEMTEHARRFGAYEIGPQEFSSRVASGLCGSDLP